MDLYEAGDHINAFKQFILTLEQNKNKSEITNPILKFMRDTTLTAWIKETESVNDDAGFISWIKEQAEAGNSYAQCYLGDFYCMGPLPRNYEEAMKLFNLSAEQGNSHAYFGLATMYATGRGCETNKSKALDLLVLSTNAEDDIAQDYLEYFITHGNKDFCELYLKNKELEDKIKILEKENEELKATDEDYEKELDVAI